MRCFAGAGLCARHHIMTSQREGNGVFLNRCKTVYFMRSCPVRFRAAKGGNRGPKDANSVRDGTAASVTGPALPPPERGLGLHHTAKS